VLSEEEIRHIAKIARIALKEEEIQTFQSQFEEIFELLSNVKELKLEDAHAYTVLDVHSVFREDETAKSEPEPILQNAPRRKERYFVVPKNL